MPKRKAHEVMTRDVFTVSADWPVKQLTRFLIDHSITGAPVVNDKNEVLGVVSLTDVANHLNVTGTAPSLDGTHDFFIPAEDGEYGQEKARNLHLESSEGLSVRDIMTPMLFTVNEEASVKDVADAMIRGRIHRVLVTQENRLVGIITSLDLLEIIRDL